MFNNSNMTDTTNGAESVILSEHLSAPPLFEEFCTAILSFLCRFLLIIVCLFPPFSFSYCIVFKSIFGVVLAINPFSASYCPLIHFRRRIAHFRRRIAHFSIFKRFRCSTNWRGIIRVVQMCGTQISILYCLFSILHHILF